MKKNLFLGIVLFLLIGLPLGLAASQYFFKDVEKGTWYEPIIQHVTDEGFMQGYKDSIFRPHSNITRAETAAIADNINRFSDFTYV